MSLKDDFAQKIILMILVSSIFILPDFVFSFVYPKKYSEFIYFDYKIFLIIISCIGIYFNFPKQEWKYSNIILVTFLIFITNATIARKLILLEIFINVGR